MNMWLALLLAAGAGLSTTIGSLLGIAVRNPGPRFMSFTLGFSAGVMLFISFVELLPKAMEASGVGFWGAQLAFFLGMGSYFLIDLFVPHEYMGQTDPAPGKKELSENETLRRTGIFVALGITIHNFPEGMATFVGAIEDVKLGMAIAVAIAIHNIPEGLAISGPIYAATGSRGKAFLWSFLSGVSEVLGAAVAALFLFPFLTPTLMGFVLAAVAGIMVLISVDELIPTAKALTNTHTPIIGLMAGGLVIVISLWMLQ